MSMGKISSEILERIRNEVDILDVVGQYVNLKRGGQNYFGLCPFHSEKTPSFTVAAHKQIYHCFGCGAGGDVIRFLMDVEQYTFHEAVIHLAKEKGIALPDEFQATPAEDSIVAKLRSVLATATQLYHHLLMHTPYGREARSYLAQRNISLETIKTFSIGYAPPDECLLPFFEKRGVTRELLVEAGLMVVPEDKTRPPYDRFRHRILFPITDPQGRVVGFGGRALVDNGPKYLNSPETRLFQKRNHLFNLSRARKHIRKDGQAIVMEGFMDVISLWQAGIPYGIAPLGTALTEMQARLIARNTDRVTLCFDADEAGQSAMERSLSILQNQQLKVKIAQMPRGLDPDDFLRQRGGDAFREEVIAGAKPIAAFKLERMKRKYQLSDHDDRLSYIAAAISFISSLPTATEQDLYARMIADEFQLSFDAVKEELRKQKFPKNSNIQRDKEKVKWNNGYQMVSKHTLGNSPTEIAEKYLVAYMIQNRQVVDWVKTELDGYQLPGEYGAFIGYLCSYYAKGNPEGFVPVLQSLEDSVLRNKIAQLGMMDLPTEVDRNTIINLVERIRQSDLHAVIKRHEQQVKQVENAGDPLKAARLGLEVIEQNRKKQKMV
jgi:DNA primase